MSRLYRQLKRSLNQLDRTEWEKKHNKIDWSYRLAELKYSAMDTLIYSWLTPITVWYESVSRILAFIPILWKHRDWDFSYSFTLFQYSLKRLRTNIELYGHHLHKDRDIKNIKITEHLIERLMGEYCEKEYEDHFNKWGGFLNKKNLNEQQEKQASKEFKAITARAKYLEAEDWKALSEMLTKHSKEWWD